MKRILLSLLLLVGMTTAGLAQTQIIMGDMNRDGQLTIADVTYLVNVLLGKSEMQYVYTNPVTGVSLNRTQLALVKDFSATLTATVAPANALVPDVTWTTSDSSVATVSEAGVVTGVSVGTATITATALDGGKAATCVVTVIIPEYVEMGPRAFWATTNVGAATPEEYGDHFAWGETAPKSNYTWDTYAFGSKDMTKYNASDGKTQLDPEDDAATQNWGEEWCMPTYKEWIWLKNNCTWTWTDDYNGTGVTGYIFTSNVPGYEGNSIFLPTAGYIFFNTHNYAGSNGFYWSSTLESSSDSELARGIYFDGSKVEWIGNTHDSRFLGRSVRPVIYVPPVLVTGISLDREACTVLKGKTLALTATITPDDASDKSVTWTSSNPSVAAVSKDGMVVASAVGTTTIIATSVDGGYTATCTVTVIEPEYVEMAPERYWATMNIGATTPEEYGDYFAWGETTPKSNYTWDTYAFGTQDNLTKYNGSDGKTVLEPEDDAATQNWGGNWRMPTDEEWRWLKENCTWTWTDDYNGTGVAGDIVTSNVSGYENKSIFLPAEGYRYGSSPYYAGSNGRYWSRTYSSNTYAWGLQFSSSGVGMGLHNRFNGQCVRPVYAPQEHEYVEMGDGLRWATCNIGASSPDEYGDYFAWGETTPKADYIGDTYAFGTEDMTKYNESDGKTVLEPEDDAATQNWGGNWRMPTYEEWTWLKENCTWTRTDDYNGTGVAGDIVTSNVSGYEGNSIFLPAAGQRDGTSFYGGLGVYWSRSLSSKFLDCAGFLYFVNDNVYVRENTYRYQGFSVRPVCPE